MVRAVDLDVISPEEREPSSEPDKLTAKELEYHERAKKEIELE